MGDWKKEGKERQDRDKAIGYCFADADKLNISDAEKQMVAMQCGGKVLTMPKEDLDKFLAVHERPAVQPSKLSPSLSTSSEDAQVKHCHEEAKKARTPRQKAEFLDWCLTDVPPEARPAYTPATVIPESTAPKSETTLPPLSFESPAGEFICPELKDDGTPCRKQLSSKYHLQQHIEQVHRKERRFVCGEIKDDGTVCGQPCSTNENLNQHIDAVHRKLKKYICPELDDDGKPCKHKFSTKGDLDKHINGVHHKLKRFICPELKEDGKPCEQKFGTMQHLNQHIDRAHRKLKPFKCTELKEDGTPCGKIVATKSELSQHIDAVHHKQKRHVCHELEGGVVCGKSYARKFLLERHIKTYHQRFRVYCSKCGKPFKKEDTRDEHEAVCTGADYEKIKTIYHIVKGGKVEDTVAGIIEQHCASLNIPTTRQKPLTHPVLGDRWIDLYCDGLEGKRIAVDITTTEYRNTMAKKWAGKRYHDYPGFEELWVVVCSNKWDSKSCADLTDEIQQDPQYENVYVYYWTDLVNIKGMLIPPKVAKLLELYEKCTLENKEECKKLWEKAKAQFHAPDFLSLSFLY